MAKPLTKFYARDREVLTGIAKTGFFYKEDIDRFYPSESRFYSLMDGNGFIKEVPYQSGNTNIYVITDEGRKFVKEK